MSDRYSIFDNQNFKYYIPAMFFKSDISWYYGDTLTINFDLHQISEHNNSIELTPEFMEGKQVVFTFYNFRYDVVYTRTYVADEVNTETYTIPFVIDAETSKLFLKGTYFCKLQLMDQEELGRNITTILPEKQLIIKVK